MSLIRLLPQNSAPWERALAAAMSDTLPVPIAEAVDPAQAPIALLPWLAVHDGVRLWFSDWSEARKRWVIAESLLANFEVGTRAGAIRYLGYVDGTLVDVVAYPSPAFAEDGFADQCWADLPPFLAFYLVHVPVTAATGGAFVEAGFIDEAFAGVTVTDPWDRALAALRAAKAPETEIQVEFQNFHRLTAGDRVLAGAGHTAGSFLPRTHL